MEEEEEEERTDKSLAMVEPDLDDDFFPKSTDLIHFAGDFPIGT